MNKKELDLLIKRNKAVSKYLGAASLETILSVIGITLDDINISKTTYAVGALFATQPGITPAITKYIKQGVWNAESNEFFKRNQKVDFTKEPGIVIRYDNSKRYVAAGHTRAKYIQNREGIDAQIPMIDVNHPKVEEYINNVEKSLGVLKRISQL